MSKSKLSLERQTQEKKKHIRGTFIIFDDLSHVGGMKKHQAGVNAELFITARDYGISIIASVHSATSLGSLARRQICTLIVFGIGNSREYQSLSEQYGQLAGRDKSIFDAIYDLAAGPHSKPVPFLTIDVNSRDPAKTFMLRLESWIVPT